MLWSAGLTQAEISAILQRIQKADPDALSGHNVTELREELAAVDLETFGLDPTTGLPLSTKLVTVTEEILEGLNATTGSPGEAAPTPAGEQGCLAAACFDTASIMSSH